MKLHCIYTWMEVLLPLYYMIMAIVHHILEENDFLWR